MWCPRLEPRHQQGRRKQPDGEVIGKVLEAMLGSGRHEHDVASLECLSPAIMKALLGHR